MHRSDSGEFSANPEAAEMLHSLWGKPQVSSIAGQLSRLWITRAEILTPAQAEAMKQHIRPMLVYLRRLLNRMNKRRFSSDDPLLLSTLNAYDAIHELHFSLHYLSCPSGVRRVPASPGDEAE